MEWVGEGGWSGWVRVDGVGGLGWMEWVGEGGWSGYEIGIGGYGMGVTG